MLSRLAFILAIPVLILTACNAAAGEETRSATPIAPAIADRPVATASMVTSPTATVTVSPAPTSDPTSVPLPPTTEPTATATMSYAYPTYDGPPIDRSNIGVQIHLHREDLSLIMDHLQALGVGWVKLQVSWKLYQPQPNGYSDERFTELDRLISASQKQGLSVLLSVSKAPEWSRSTAEMDGPPTDYGLFEEFLRYLSGRYQGRVTAYELWNEPNLRREWNGAPLSATDLVALTATGAAAIRSSDPKAIIISGAPAPTGINDGISAIDDRIYLSAMLNGGIAELVDVIGAHPYGWSNPPESSVANPAAGIPSHADHASFFFQDTLNDYRDIVKNSGEEKQIWVTEFGWGSFERFNRSPPAGAEFMSAVSEWQQAQYVLTAYELAQSWEWVGPMVLWNLNFGPTLGHAFSEAGYSLLHPDGGPRPVYEALRALPKR